MELENCETGRVSFCKSLETVENEEISEEMKWKGKKNGIETE